MGKMKCDCARCWRRSASSCMFDPQIWQRTSSPSTLAPAKESQPHDFCLGESLSPLSQAKYMII